MNAENYINNIPNSPESIETLDKLLEKIKTPAELLDYMGKNIKYGYVGKENNKIYKSSDQDFDTDFEKEYFLQTPEQLLLSKHGVCWDQTELERSWFTKQKFDPKLYFLMFVKETANNLPTHTFLVYKNNDKFYWFENSFGDYRGVHEYDNLDTLTLDVKNKQFNYAQEYCGAETSDSQDIKICEYETPEFGCNPDEFISNVTNKKY